jgi:hypothetical protein
VAGDQIISVVAVRNGNVAATRVVSMVGRVFVGAMTGRTFVWVGGIHGDGVFVRVRTMRVMQMAVIRVIHVSVVVHGDVAAARIVCMLMAVVGSMLRGAGDSNESHGNQKGDDLFHGQRVLDAVNEFAMHHTALVADRQATFLQVACRNHRCPRAWFLLN